ncbi:MAG: DHH family phosphoesterase, partial [Peptococcaceae bacterium]|nr:DHH family phosphoesterase [Peptococcaceae bacterium]
MGVSLITAQLLINRGLYTVEQCRDFFNCTTDRLFDPYLMRDMDKAVTRIAKAVRDREKILINGDYDTDGITATALLAQVLAILGCQVETYIPNRINEGYGLHVGALEQCLTKNITLVITVDCGISAFDEATWCNSHGVDLIITDHHEPSGTIPEALAVLNPKRTDCGYPFKGLAGVGVALKLAQAVLDYCQADNGSWQDYLDLCCLGTIADMVPLLGENRILVKIGLEQLSSSQRPGLLALKQQCGAKESINADDVSFQMAPRLNAAGRVAQADIALKLLMTDSMEEAWEIAEDLYVSNTVRQEIGNNIFAEALGIVHGQPELANANILVLASPQWHQGVLGIVAAR